MARTAAKTAQPDLLAKIAPAPAAKPPVRRGKQTRSTGTALATVRPTAADTPKNMLQVIANAARDPSVDVGKMQALLSMQMEIMREQARIEYNTAFMAMENKLPKIKADGRIEIPAKREGGKPQSTPYAKYPTILKACQPIMREDGFAYNTMAEPGEGGRLHVKCVLRHRGGHQQISIFPLALDTSGSKNNVQGTGSSMSYGKRYGLIGLLNLVNEEEDDRHGQQIDFDAAPEDAPKITPQQKQKLASAMGVVGLSERKFCTGYSLQRIEDLPASLFDDALRRVKDYGAKK